MSVVGKVALSAGAASLILLVPQSLPAQWTEPVEGQLVIRGGWLGDSGSDERRPAPEPPPRPEHDGRTSPRDVECRQELQELK